MDSGTEGWWHHHHLPDMGKPRCTQGGVMSKSCGQSQAYIRVEWCPWTVADGGQFGFCYLQLAALQKWKKKWYHTSTSTRIDPGPQTVQSPNFQTVQKSLSAYVTLPMQQESTLLSYLPTHTYAECKIWISQFHIVQISKCHSCLIFG